MDVLVYRITGRQGKVTVPDWVCRECDQTVAAVQEASRRACIEGVRVVVRPWLAHVAEAWRAGARHPPVVMIDGLVYSQAVVPDPDRLAAYLRQLTGLAAPGTSGEEGAP